MNIVHKETTQKVTVSKIASLAGVSPATVSRVMNQRSIVAGETYTKVANAMKELGYTPQKSTQESVLPTAGLILLNLPSFSNPFYDSIIKGARASIERHGYSTLIYEGPINHNTIDHTLKMIKQNKVTGFITMNSVETSLMKKLADATCVVQCCEYNDDANLPFVSIDDTAAARNAVDHLLGQGRRRIAFINGPIHYKYASHRLAGYTKALTDAGLPIIPEYIIQLPEIDSDLAISSALQLLSLSNPPDAFFVISDIFGAAVLRACYLSGKKVPEEIAVVGFDNLEIAKILTPSLTSISQPKSQLGFMAAEAVFEKLADPSTPNKEILLDTELIVRESSSNK